MRWGNSGRAAIVVGLLGLAIAWPRLAPPPPRLPSDAGVPVAPPEAVAAGERGGSAAPRKHRAKRERVEDRRGAAARSARGQSGVGRRSDA